MAQNSAIEWCTATWNPLAGCTPAGDDCRNCYAASMALRLEAMGQEKYRGTAKRVKSDGRAVFTGKINLDHAALELPLRWKKPQRIFVNSMSDLFHKDVPDHFILEVFATMERAPWHTFQVLTKRPDRMMAWVQKHQEWVDRAAGEGEYLRRYRHVWCGTSIGADCYTWRAAFLRDTPAAVRFISAEPLLSGLPSLNLESIHQVIAGGESGPRARPCWPSWVEELRDRCQDAGVAFFFKQWGEYEPYEEDAQPPFWRDQHGRLHDGHWLNILDPETGGMGKGWHEDSLLSPYAFRRVGKHNAGRLLDGVEWNEFPDVREVTR